MSIHALSIFAVASLALATSPALADSEQTNNKAAKKACLTGDFRKGADILAQLYVDTGDPTHLFNQGRCYEQNHRWQEAIDAFREYLRKAPGLSPVEKAETEKHLADCEAFLAKENPGPAQAEVVAHSREPPGTPPWPTAVAATTSRPAPRGSAGSGLRMAGLITGGFGLAATGAGIGFNLKANQLADQVNRHYSRSKACQ